MTAASCAGRTAAPRAGALAPPSSWSPWRNRPRPTATWSAPEPARAASRRRTRSAQETAPARNRTSLLGVAEQLGFRCVNGAGRAGLRQLRSVRPGAGGRRSTPTRGIGRRLHLTARSRRRMRRGRQWRRRRRRGRRRNVWHQEAQGITSTDHSRTNAQPADATASRSRW